MNQLKGYKLYCKSCGRNHIFINDKCPDCNRYDAPTIRSEKVAEKCHGKIYICEGCEAYNEHLS